MGKHVHVVSNKNLDTLTGDCRECGPVKLKSKRANGWYCENALKEYQDKSVKLRRAGRDYLGHGLTHAEAMAYREGKSCEICGSPPKTGSRGHVVDHDHLTGKVRGVLCNRCNFGLAFVEIAGWVEKALRYLKNHKNS